MTNRQEGRNAARKEDVVRSKVETKGLSVLQAVTAARERAQGLAGRAKATYWEPEGAPLLPPPQAMTRNWRPCHW